MRGFGILWLATLLGCGGGGGADDPDASGGIDAGGERDAAASDAEPGTDAGRPSHDDGGSDGGGVVDRGPTILPLDGDPNGLFWSADEGTLYVADDDNNRVVRWRHDGFVTPVALPAFDDERGPGLGQVIRHGDGRVFVARFGYGTLGAVIEVATDGTTREWPDLDPTRRRIGLAVDGDGAVYSAWFVGPAGSRVGGVSRLESRGETDLAIEGLVKPVGILVREDVLFVADQDQGRVLRVPLDDVASTTTYATPPSADLLAATASGLLFTGGRTGEVFRIATDGSFTVFQSDLQEVRGLAYDEAAGRLFVASHDGDATDGETHRLHVFPVD
jgi:sugar lactone lactonase YvrE